MLRLRFHSGPRAGSDLTTPSPTVRIGRDPNQNDVVIADEQVSSRHLIITATSRGEFLVEDAGSANGTFVNDQKLSARVRLHPGDQVRVGTTSFNVGEGRAHLAVTGGSSAGRNFPLSDRALTIGRAADNECVLDGHLVSAFHAAVLPLPEGYVLKDNGSTNGTVVNGAKVKSHPLSDGDVVQIGTSELRFLVEDDDVQPEPHESLPGNQSVYATLTFVAGPHQGQAVPIGDDQVIFGRKETSTFAVNDTLVSGSHFAVTRQGAQFQLTDLGSSNGTHVNGARILRSVTLESGDLIEFGTSVVEFRISGGVPVGKDAPALVIAAEGYAVTAQPKFLIEGHVKSANEMTLGRAPSCDLRLDGAGISGVHCKIVWADDAFFVEDISRYGTFIGDKRIVREKLVTGHVIRIGPNLLSISVRGERCALDRVDAATAMAAIEVARERANSLAGKSGSRGGAGPSRPPGYKTVFALDLPDAEALVQERKAKFRQGAPAWRPSTDILPDSLVTWSIVAAAASAVIIATILLLTDRADALVNHPLSEAHSSKLFALQAEKQDESLCGACHTTGRGVPAGKCETCHEGFGQLRDQHAQTHACAACHQEHRGMPRFDALAVPTMLGAQTTCARGGCHENQHAKEFTRASEPPPRLLAAGPVPQFGLPQEDFHARHAVVEQNGKPIAIGCQSCHGRAQKDGSVIAGIAGQACFHCHQGGENFVNQQCASCHADEHASNTVPHRRSPAGAPAMARVVSDPTPAHSLAKGGALALGALLPFAGVAFVYRLRRRRRAEAFVQRLSELPTEVVKRLVHSINTDKCVGCNLCVQACPASVLELVNHKSAVVNFDSCIQCKKCEVACAFDALRMHDADKPPPMVAMPEVDRYYQTQVAGMYLIGQAAGTPQVKNASNLGRAAVDHMVREGLAPGAGQAAGAEFDVVIIGSGPAGLSAALSCVAAGLRYCVLEKQRDFAWTIRNYYHKGKPVMAEPHTVEMVGLLPHWDTNREDLLARWQELIAEKQVDLRFSYDVKDVKKAGVIFNIDATDKAQGKETTLTALRVVVAIGTMGSPRTLGCPGEDLEKVRNALVDPDDFVDKDIIVVGGTDSAIEVALALAGKNRVALSCRRQKFDRVKPKNLQLIEAAFADGRVKPLFVTGLKSVSERTAQVEHLGDGRIEEVPNDAVFAMIGGNPPVKWLQAIGIGYTEKPHSWSPPRTDDLSKELVRA